MSEPKKETVRIVLPPRREGQPLASTPRESAMINLPPKPVAAPPSAPTVPPSAPGIPAPSIPPSPSNLQPPSAPGIPKPPSFPGVPKPPGAPMAPSAPKPMSAPPAVAGVPSGIPRPASVGPTPVAVKPQPKKETAKVASTSGLGPKPQATVRLQPRPVPTSAASSQFKVQSSEITPVITETTEEEIPMNLAIAALVTAVLALAVQVWFMI